MGLQGAPVERRLWGWQALQGGQGYGIDTEVLRINRSMFRRILEEYPETAEALRAQIIEDLQALIKRIEQVGERLG